MFYRIIDKCHGDLVRTAYSLLLVLVFAGGLQGQDAKRFHIVLQGGRVIDPETGFDGQRSVGIVGERIAEISDERLRGDIVIDVSGLVVSPGFIDIHAHGQSAQANEYQVRDGVTTALELEGGSLYVANWLKARSGNAIVNFGASASHAGARSSAMVRYRSQSNRMARIVENEGLASSKLAPLQKAMFGARNESLSDAETQSMVELLETSLAEGALGIGAPVGYYPGATRAELLEVYKLAASRDVPVFSHVRDSNFDGIQEAIANASVTGAPLHLVHINSMSLSQIETGLEMVASAQARGLDITTELYPYTAASTYLQSTLFDDGWQEKMGISYPELQWIETGERLTEATFRKYRETGGVVIIHMMRPEWILSGIQSPIAMIASDGMPYAPGAHSRSAGTFSRVLGRYVRERKALSLMEALSKMTIMPAKRVEKAAPSMRFKGRLQVGCDADITVFDPVVIIDTATFEGGLSYSKGVQHVIVNGVLVVESGQTVGGAFPGRPVIGKHKR